MRRAAGLGALLPAAFLCLGVAGWLAGHKTESARGVGMPAAAAAPSPGVRFVTVALGGFRGLLVDALWFRIAQLQEDGKFFEVAQMAAWITRLEPTYPEVWSFHAWNLAYNIGAMFPDPADRWHWVTTGVRLLRDEGIPANQGEAQLYWELGWLYADKVSGRWDEAGVYYRAAFAAEITELLGGGSFDEGVVRGNADRQARLAGAGLAPALMKTVDERYGPLDWRLPEAHALYWAERGRRLTKPYAVWCDRLVWHAMAGMAGGGRLYFDPKRRIYLRGPRPDLAAKGVRACGQEGVFAAPLAAGAAETFLREAMAVLLAQGRTNEASEALAVLQRHCGVDGRAAVATLLSGDLRLRHEGLSIEVSRGVMERLLTESCAWKALGEEDPARGLEALARLHWDALAAAAKPGEPWGDPDAWSALCDQARERAEEQLGRGE
jgi:hypothetical protein